MKKNIKKHLLLFMVIFLLIVLLLTFLRKQNQAVSKNESFQTVVLYGNDSEDDLQILKQRLEDLVGSDNYVLTENEYSLELSINPTIYKTLSLSEFLEYFITEPNLYRLYEYVDDYHASTVYTPDDSFIIDRAENGLYVSFPEVISNKVETCLTEEKDIALIKNDLYTNYTTNDIYGDGYSIDEKKGENQFFISIDDEFLDEVYYSLTHAKLSTPYNYKLIEDISWEDISDFPSNGANQCNFDDISEPYYICSFTNHSLNGRANEEEHLSIEHHLTARLDMLDTPYAIGSTFSGSFIVKLPTNRINGDILSELITNDDIYVTDQYGFKEKVTFAETSTDNSKIIIPFSTENYSIFHASLSKYASATKKKKETFYLTINDCIVASTTIPTDYEKDEIIFSNIKGEQSASSLPQWYYDFVRNLLDNSKLPYDLSLDYYCYNGKVYDDSSHFGASTPSFYHINEVASKVKKLCPNAEITLEYNDRLSINLNLEPDDSLVPNMFTLIPKVYEAVDLRSQSFSDLWIHPFQHENEERSWFIFSKDENYKIYFQGLFYNGRCNSYIEEMKDMLETDTFFSEFVNSNQGEWIY